MKDQGQGQEGRQKEIRVCEDVLENQISQLETQADNLRENLKDVLREPSTGDEKSKSEEEAATHLGHRLNQLSIRLEEIVRSMQYFNSHVEV